MDYHYSEKEKMLAVVKGVRTKTVIAAPSGQHAFKFIEKATVLRGDLRFKPFHIDTWEMQNGSSKAEEWRDYMFLSYIAFRNGYVLMFVSRFYDPVAKEYKLSNRTERLILDAYKLGVKYELIEDNIPKGRKP